MARTTSEDHLLLKHQKFAVNDKLHCLYTFYKLFQTIWISLNHPCISEHEFHEHQHKYGLKEKPSIKKAARIIHHKSDK